MTKIRPDGAEHRPLLSFRRLKNDRYYTVYVVRANVERGREEVEIDGLSLGPARKAPRIAKV